MLINMQRVVLGMSGGVDSSVAAYILKKKGYDVLGVFMKNWSEEDENGVCTAKKDFDDVRAVCEKLDIPYFDVNFEEEYQELVFQYFLDELSEGRTPNPDIMCNNEIKFKAFLDFAMDVNADYMATGHFARVRHLDTGNVLEKGVDANKDQSYFLSGLTNEQLQKALFPLGEMTKNEVRKIAKELELVNADKKDSTGICFIGERDFNEFLSRYLPNKPGEIKDYDSGNVVGHHDGLMYYTIGQRKGLGIGGNGINQPWFVVNKEIKNDILWVAQGKDNPVRFAYGLITETQHWISHEPELPIKCNAKFRYRQPDRKVTVHKINQNQLMVEFDKPEAGITPGQAVVFYDGNICLGNGIIKSEIKESEWIKEMKPVL
ncbi:MAG: tRNA 2-thiouridine(34) synthase MnmA [Bacteroidales bacterium]|nr:tRNA 2-thiouridine(34) synthase MnmA [Bacteroidales bacterium]